jgi:hypothetical protein
MPWEKKFTLEFDTLPEAKQYEAKIKKMKSRIYCLRNYFIPIPKMFGKIENKE